MKIGRYVESFVEWISVEFSGFFDLINSLIGGMLEGFKFVLNFLPPVVMIIILSLLIFWIISGSKNIFKRKNFRSNIGLTVFSFLGLFLLYNLRFWEATMDTLALILSSAIISLSIGLPLGILSAKNDRVERIVRPLLDFMQTMPAFVYLIPAILLFGVGDVPGILSTVVFALPPAVRLTNLGIRGVQKEVVEAAKSFGCTDSQLLIKVEIPLALPTIMAGINQVIMLSLSMVVIASMVGAGGLGSYVYKGITQAKLDLGFEAGLGIFIIAILLDRVTQSLSKKK